jgi:hypothetical protein
MIPDEFTADLSSPSAALAQPVTINAPEDLKAKECDERQVEMDAIANFCNQHEFPAVAGAYVDPAARG